MSAATASGIDIPVARATVSGRQGPASTSYARRSSSGRSVGAETVGPVDQLPARLRVGDVDPGPQDGDRAAAGGESSPMRRGVDPSRRAAHDAYPRAREASTDVVRDLVAERRAVAGAHHGDGLDQLR